MPEHFLFDTDLHALDPDASRMIQLERRRQAERLILIASESICPRPVREAVASEFANIYAEGYPSTRMSVWERDRITDVDRHLAFYRRYADRRYYKGTEFCDFVEVLAQRRAAQMFARHNAFGIRPEDIRVNVQPLSGAAANNAVYTALIQPGETVMGIELSHGGHLTHGSPFNRSGQTYDVVRYLRDEKTGRLDYDQIIDLARTHKPKLLIAGGSALPWALDWEAMRRAADAAGAKLLADVAHPSGLIVAGEYPNPLGYADIIMTTTHKTLCGPRGAILVSSDAKLADKLDMAVFPGEQGGPHVNAIAGKAVSFGIALSDGFKRLMQNVKTNAAAFADELQTRGFNVLYGGTESHLFLLDCKRFPGVKGNVNGDIASRILDIAGMTLNKNSVAGDRSAANPSGMRIGTTWISQLGFDEAATRELAGTMADVLTALQPFDVIGAFGHLGRAKLPLDVLQGAQARVRDLLARHPWEELNQRVQVEEASLFGGGSPVALDISAVPEAEDGAALAATTAGCAVADASGGTLIEVRGERAGHFLQLLTTADIAALQPGSGTDTLFLDGNGSVLAMATVYRDSGFGEHDQRRYWVLARGESRETLTGWFRGHTDGYILFEPRDLYAKVDGPVVAIDRRDRFASETGAPVFRSFALLGPQAQQTLTRAFPEAPDLAANTCAGIDGTSIGLTRGGVGGANSIEVHVHAHESAGVWQRLLEAGAIPLSPAAADTLRRPEPARGTPIAGVRDTAPIAHASPYFVGCHAAVQSGEGQPAFKWTDSEVPDDKLRKSCLYDEHIKLKGRMVPFAGWSMPVMYTGSISEEHRAVRTACGLFDVSHMGVFEFRGPGAQRFLDQLTTNYVTKLRRGEAHYSYLLGAGGDVLDDIFVYCRDFDRYMVVVNAANADKNEAWIRGVVDGRLAVDPERPWVRLETCGVQFVNLKDDESQGDARRVDLALQGRSSYKVLRSMADRTTAKAITDLPRTHFLECTLEGIDVIIAKTGYTGEAVGCELYVHPDRAPGFWQKLLARHDDFGIEAVGLGARDSTRTEAGFPLYGHELAGPYEIGPTEAGYGSFVKRHKPFFCGREGFLARESKRAMEIVRFRVSRGGVRTLHTGAPVVNRRGQCIGYVTSAALVGSRQIGLAWVKRQFIDPGTRIGIFIPPKREPKGDAPHPHTLAVGDNVALHEEAVVLTRFPAKGETRSNLEA